MKFLVLVSGLLMGTISPAVAQRRGGGGGNNGNNDSPPQPPPPPPPPRGATQVVWGQCGGRDWEYATACPTAAVCYNDGDNEWYSQCVPMESVAALQAEHRASVAASNSPAYDQAYSTLVTSYVTVYTTASQQGPPPPPPQTVTLFPGVPDSPIG